MDERHLSEEAYRRYWDKRESLPSSTWLPFPYDTSQKVRLGKWQHFCGILVSSELEEAINLLNSWGHHLLSWSIWIDILSGFDEDDSWTLRIHYVDPIAFVCMFQPSAARDRLTMIATNAIHQGNIVAVPGYKDELKQDRLKPGQYLSRNQKEKQLDEIGTRWSTYAKFSMMLMAINEKAYRDVTANFRNHSSHGIAPRFELGYTNMITREMAPMQNMVELGGGRVQFVDDHSRMVVRYGVGGTAPLKYEDILAANKQEYELVKAALERYEALLQEILQKIGIDPEETEKSEVVTAA